MKRKTPQDPVSTEIDLHGVRLEDAETEVLQFIDRLYYHGETSGRIIHGMGVIAKHLPRWLKSYPYVKSFDCAPFNRGVTIVVMSTAR